MKKLSIAILCLLLSLRALAQSYTISGSVTDDTGKPVGFASIYIKGTTKGTSANSEGRYNLNITGGEYDVLFRAIGYKQETRHISLKSSTELNVKLSPENYQLKEVAIHAGGEDPAYAIIRKAIRKRKTYLHEVEAYSCDVYIKGLQRMLKAPKKFMGYDINAVGKELGLDSNRRGIFYLSESESKYTFMQPDKVHEEMISSKVSGRNQAFSFNRASDLQINFYNNLQDLGGLSTRPLVSPIADNALLFYNYKLIGITVENGETINKIQVIPKRRNDPVVEGYIYIADDSWRIYSVNVAVVKNPNINLLDTFKVSQQYFPVSGKAWMPSSLRLEFTGGLVGFHIGGYYIAVYKNYDLKPVVNKKEFAEVMRVTRDVARNDSAYWQHERPVPLTAEESNDYVRKEKLAQKHESKAYKDSLDKVFNKVTLSKLLLTGIFINHQAKNEGWRLSSILNSVGFNSVEGFFADYGVSYFKRIDTVNRRYLSLGGKVRYGFSDHLLHATGNGNIPVGNFNLGFSGGSDMLDINNRLTLPDAFNTYYSLIEHRNYEKLYQKNYGTLSFGGRITGGLIANVSAEYADRKWLPNTSNYSFFHRDRQYTSNNPFTPDQDIPLFPENQAFKLRLYASYDFSNRYVTYPMGKYYLPSPYPKIEFSYIDAVKNVFGSDAQYQQLYADVTKSNMSLGLYGKTSFWLGAGTFINAKQIYYVDEEHFDGNEAHLYQPAINSFLLLPFYTYSTGGGYIEGHLEHNFSGFILNKLPLVRKLKLQEIVDVNYLTTKELKNYTELGLGLQYLNVRFMYANSWDNNTHLNGFRIGVYLH